MSALKAYMVGCCGCGRFLKTDGTITESSVYENGAMRRDAFTQIADFPGLASFDTTRECDQAAIAAGWRIEMGSNRRGNHRCPECGFEREQPVGMIVDTRSLEVVS